MALRSVLFLPLGFLLVSTTSAHAARLDVDDISALLAGSDQIAGVYFDQIPDYHEEYSFSEVWFDGVIYTYLYGVYTPYAMTIAPPFDVLGEERADRIELQTDLHEDVTWGMTSIRNETSTVGNVISNTSSTWSMGPHDPTIPYQPLDLVDGRIQGGPFGTGSGGMAAVWYIQSPWSPTTATLLTIYSVLVGLDDTDPFPQRLVLTNTTDVYAPGAAPVPEPTSILLFLSGGALCLRRMQVARRRNRPQGAATH